MASTSAFSRFLSHFNFLRALRDFRSVWVQDNPYRWRFALISLVATGSIFSVMFQEEHRVEPRAPEITYFEVFAPGRSDEEIMASNIANQKEKDRLTAEQEAREENVRKIYETIGRASGMDVDAVRARAEAERAAREAAEEEARQRVLAEIDARRGE